MSEFDELEELIWIEGLKNAIQFDGKANPKAVMGKIMAERKDLRKEAQKVLICINKIVKEINTLDLSIQRKKVLEKDSHALDVKEKEEEKRELPSLPNTKTGEVVMRLAPFPSGALHIGNARMVVLNDEYVKKYNGKLLLVFDDTIGTTLAKMNDPKAKYVIPEAYDLIPEGLEWLGVKYHNVYYKSDRVEIYQNEARKLIDNGDAYVCTCPAKVFSLEYKRPGKECPCRNKDLSHHQELYEQMQEGKIEEGGAVVRLKTGMDQKDPALRDHILMRISDAPHPRIGTKVRLWPVLEWSWGLDDHLLGITHIIRGIDLRKEGLIEKFIWDLYGWKHSEILLYGRMKFDSEYKLSKTFTRQQIEKDIYEGWSDPRSWSLQSLKARGIRPEALRHSLKDLGLSNRGIVFDKDWVYSYNRTLIDRDANRYWFVEDPVPIQVLDIPQELLSNGSIDAEPLINPNFPKLRSRTVNFPIDGTSLKAVMAKNDLETARNHKGHIIYHALEKGQVIRLKDIFNVSIIDVGNKIIAKFHSEEVLPKSRKIQAVPFRNNVKVKILQPNGNLTQGLGEINLCEVKPDTVVQFERYGYVNLRNISASEIYGYYTND